MSNVELIQQIYSAMERRDLTAIPQMFDSEIQISQTELLPWGGRYKGMSGAMDFFGRLMANVQSKIETERFIDAGETIVQIGHTIGKTVRSGKEFRIAEVHVWKVKNGKAVSMEAYIDTPGMLDALK